MIEPVHVVLTIPRMRLAPALIAAVLLASSSAHTQPRNSPEKFAPGVISDAREQWRITFTPDGRTAYFAASDGFFPITRNATIYVSHLANNAWSTPTVAPFSGTYSDMDPALSSDGSRLYFSSIRPVNGKERGDLDLWMVERTANGWSTPIRLGDEVNSTNDELYPSVSTAGTLFFASGPRAPIAGQHYDIYSATRNGHAFNTRAALGSGVNRVSQANDPHPQAAWEFNPEISPDGTTLFFTSLRPGGAGLGDIYVSRLQNGVWTAARNLGAPINTAADEYHPTRSPDGNWLYFVRRNGHGDFYRVPLAPLLTAQPPQPTGVLDALLQAGRAQQQGNNAELRRLLHNANTLSTGNGQVLYILAREEARAGNTHVALSLLQQLAVSGSSRDLRTDSSFALLDSGSTRTAFHDIAARIVANAAPIVRSDTVHVMRDGDFIPEGLAWDPRSHSLFIGSLHRRSVMRIDASAAETEFVSPGRDGIGQVLGMQVDSIRNQLVLATLVLDSAAARHSNGGGGWAFLHRYDLATGRLLERVAAPDSTQPHLLNDVAVLPNGDIYVTDTEAHAVYVRRTGTTRLEKVSGDNPMFRYPNGIAFDGASGRLYVAHFEGISVGRVDGTRLPLQLLARPVGVAGGGIDGLYFCSNRLIAVQGLFGFQQVTAFELSKDGQSIVGAEALERRHPIYDWATTGALVNGDLHYIANGQLRRLSPQGVLSNATIPGKSAILRIEGVCR